MTTYYRTSNFSSCDPIASLSASQLKLTGKDEDASSSQTIPFHDQPQKHERNNHLKMKANEIYGVSTDGIETTPNEVYGVGTDGIETTPNEVYGVGNDGIETTPNEVYGVGTDGIETTPNEAYVINCIGTGTPANEQRQQVTMNRQTGPSPTHTYEDIII